MTISNYSLSSQRMFSLLNGKLVKGADFKLTIALQAVGLNPAVSKTSSSPIAGWLLHPFTAIDYVSENMHRGAPEFFLSMTQGKYL
jgi:hypothetical protein